MGKLYVVGTPIGNLGDLSVRAAKVLSEVDFIAAEDTRVSLKLLNYLDIKKPMVSYFEHNIRQRGEEIINRILAGENCAIITDAGMPCISDPGEDLVALCHQNGVPMEVVPGPSAVISALAISGISTKRFSFQGFLSTTKKNRFAHLEEIKHNTETLIFYEAPHKLLSTLRDMRTYLGNRRISLCRELTKLHEEVFLTTLDEAVAHYTENNPKGEFVLVIEGADPAASKEEVTLEQAVQMVRELIEKGDPPTMACKKIAAQSGFKKSELYAQITGE
ncbi:MAG: 16S rRNA (cytidine(1402)-2'-O)-methyltransferase [Oscillospiraceae bacterium]|nr:16S rRNA (cytidine(1402)-2'-O)-methyltransferase [Oscillospiraceae bacterium]